MIWIPRIREIPFGFPEFLELPKLPGLLDRIIRQNYQAGLPDTTQNYKTRLQNKITNQAKLQGRTIRQDYK